ncbi:MAG: hypothetical protein J6334_05800 [Kiritimatiellae bacterium]|nr:hypothetical protein [Kiritimatiellia bacterium]
MRLRNVSAEEARALGIPLPAKPQRPSSDPMVRAQRCSVLGRDPALTAAFTASFPPDSVRPDDDGHI